MPFLENKSCVLMSPGSEDMAARRNYLTVDNRREERVAVGGLKLKGGPSVSDWELRKVMFSCVCLPDRLF